MKTEKEPMFREIPMDRNAPLNSNFGLVLAVDALKANALAHIVAAITDDPSDPEKLLASITFHIPTRELAVILVNAILEEIDKTYFDGHLDAPEGDGEEEDE